MSTDVHAPYTLEKNPLDQWLMNKEWPRRALATPPAGSDLRPVPGDAGLPLVGHTVEMLRLGMDFAVKRYRVLGPAYHLVLVVDAPVAERVRRVRRDRGMSEEDARARIAAQASEAARRATADVWLDNGGSRDEVLAVVDALWADRLVRYESNLRLGRKARYGAPRLVDPDPTWPAQAERLATRIRFAAGDRALSVDHIGSTSVPGLPAKDVIDLQLTVSSLDDADAVAGALTEAGFLHQPGADQDQVHEAVPDPEQWRKRYFTGTDPGRVVHLHARARGSAGWEFALRFRDWLRADDAIRAEYLALKRDLAHRFAADDSGARYADAKEPWFAEVYPRLREWSARTGRQMR